VVEERAGKGISPPLPELKKVFANAAAAAKALPKEQNAALAAQTKALEEVQSQLASFRRQ
jgi:hypothetical protein